MKKKTKKVKRITKRVQLKVRTGLKSGFTIPLVCDDCDSCC